MARILVIDDNQAVRAVLIILLEQQGHQVATAKDGRTGLASVERDAFDLPIVDIFTPEMGGIETMRAVRKSRPSMPLIAIRMVPSMHQSRFF